MPRFIAVANLKGGTGKSTIAVNVASALASRRSRVALVDADSQETATFWAGQGHLPVSLHTLPLETDDGARQWIGKVLNIDAEWVVIDCPPHLRAATSAAIGLSDLVLVPATASGADLLATQRAVELVGDARKRRDDDGPQTLLVPSRIDRRTSTGREFSKALEQLEPHVSPELRQRAVFVDSFTAGQWVGDYQPNGPAHSDVNALVRTIKRRLNDK